MSSQCPNCRQSQLQIPRDEHPSYLICPSCSAIQLTYEPQDYQTLFHTTPTRYNQEDQSPRLQVIGVFGGYGSAKSTATLHEFFLRTLESPNSIGLITAPTFPLLEKTSWKTLIDEIIPPPLIHSVNNQKMVIVLTNGYTIYGIPSDEETKLRSINAGHVHIEEASGIKRSIFDQLVSRMRHPRANRRAIFVCSNPDLGWIKDVIVNNPTRSNPNHPEHEHFNPDITCYIWETALNRYLPKDFIENLSKNRPDWWVKRYLYGSFDHAEGMVYPNAGTIITTAEESPIKPEWERIVGADFGLRNATVLLFGAIDPKTGQIIIYQEYYVTGKTVPEHAKAIKPILGEIPSGLLRFMVGDPSMRNRNTANGESVMGLYREYGIYFLEGNNQLEAGILKVNSYIDRKRLKIYSTCTNTLRELINYKFPEVSMDETKNADERPIKRDDHAPDALRYMMMRLPDDPDLLKTQSYDSRKTTKEQYDNLYESSDTHNYRHYEKLSYLGVGY